MSLFIFLASVFCNSFIYEFATELNILNGESGLVIWNGLYARSPSCSTILDNWVFEKFILANEPFAKALRIF